MGHNNAVQGHSRSPIFRAAAGIGFQSYPSDFHRKTCGEITTESSYPQNRRTG